MRIGLSALLFIPAAVAAQGPSVFSRSEEIGLAKSAENPRVGSSILPLAMPGTRGST
jgi:hypothetical protein